MRPLLEQEKPGKEMAIMDGHGVRKPLAGIAHPKAQEPTEGRGLTLDEILESNGGGCYFRQHGQEPPQIS